MWCLVFLVLNRSQTQFNEDSTWSVVLSVSLEMLSSALGEAGREKGAPHSSRSGEAGWGPACLGLNLDDSPTVGPWGKRTSFVPCKIGTVKA